MAIYPGAVKRLIPKHNRVAITRYRRVNLHVAVSNADSIHSHFSQADTCSHFYVRDSGVVEQYIDTKYMSKADLDGNDSTISIETEGGVSNVNGEKWTDAQVRAIAALWKWLRDTHKIKNQIAKGTYSNDASAGLSWHRLGIKGNFEGRPGLAKLEYGGIYYSKSMGKECPGDAKINQIPEIFALANASAKPASTKEDTLSAAEVKQIIGEIKASEKRILDGVGFKVWSFKNLKIDKRDAYAIIRGVAAEVWNRRYPSTQPGASKTAKYRMADHLLNTNGIVAQLRTQNKEALGLLSKALESGNVTPDVSKAIQDAMDRIELTIQVDNPDEVEGK